MSLSLAILIGVIVGFLASAAGFAADTWQWWIAIVAGNVLAQVAYYVLER
jgi:hypothetical protein